jgi:hypothetical protein
MARYPRKKEGSLGRSKVQFAATSRPARRMEESGPDIWTAAAFVCGSFPHKLHSN